MNLTGVRELCWKPLEDWNNCDRWAGHTGPCLATCGDCKEGRCHIPIRPPRPGVGDPGCGCARHADSLLARELDLAAERLQASAGVLIRDPAGQILLVKPTYRTAWDLPGGMVEPGESPRDAARRELKEELGLDWTPGRLLVIDFLPPRPGRLPTMAFVYDGGEVGHHLPVVLPPEELSAWAWCSHAEMKLRVKPTAPILASRIGMAAYAVKIKTTFYLESGCTVV